MKKRKQLKTEAYIQEKIKNKNKQKKTQINIAEN